MRSIRLIAFMLVAAIALVSCRGNSEAAKKRYLESGDKYFNKGRYKEASIQYRNAIRIDQRYGLAYYKLALTDLKQDPPDYNGAFKALLRATDTDLISPDQPEHWDAVVKLSEIYLIALSQKYDQQFMEDVRKNWDALLDRDRNSFDGHRLKGEWMLVVAKEESEIRRTKEGRELLDGAPASPGAPAVVAALDGRKPLDVALEEYRKADSIKPGDQGVTIKIAAVLFTKGAVLARAGDVAAAKTEYSAAEQIYRKTIDQKKDFLPAYDGLYSLLWGQGKRAEAEQLLKAGYQNNPKQFGFLLMLASEYLSEGRRDDMVNVLAQLKSKVGEYPEAYMAAGYFYLRARDFDAAIREYREGMGKDAKNRIKYQKLIVEARVRQGKPTEAEDANAEILKENPNDADANAVKANMDLGHGDVAKALVELQQAVTHAPDNFVAHYNLGRAYFLHAEYEQARQQFQKAIEIKTSYMPPRLAMAQLQARNGEFEAAIRSAQDIIKLNAYYDTYAKLIWSEALLGQGKFDDARKMLEDMLKANPSNPDVLFQIGVVNLAEKKFKDAEDAFRRCYQLNPADPRGLLGVVDTYMAQHKTDQAIQLLQAETAKTPARSEFHIALGKVEVRAGRWDAAISEFQKVLSSSAKGSKAQGEMYLRIGQTQRLKGDLNAAIISLQAARQSLPEDNGVLSTLALILDSAGRWTDAEKVYQAASKLPSGPHDAVVPIVLNNLAFGMAEHGEDLDQALSMAQRAKQLGSDMPEISDTLGWIYLKKNLPDNALEIFQGLVNKMPNQTTFRYHLGLALSQKGDKVRALQELKKALAGSPSDQERKQIQALITSLG